MPKNNAPEEKDKLSLKIAKVIFIIWHLKAILEVLKDMPNREEYEYINDFIKKTIPKLKCPQKN